jgi:ABC-type transport system involved in multi-copper enzyme maturation permease subunit
MTAPPIKQPLPTAGWLSTPNPRYPSSASKHFVWKEFRQIAPLMIVFVALMVFTLIAANHERVSKLASYNTSHQAFWYAITMPFLALYSMTLGVFLFSPEKESKTVEMLSRLPITSGFVLRSKVIVGLMSILGFVAIGAVCQLLEWLVFNGVIATGTEVEIWTMIGAGFVWIVLIPMECFFWGVICSVAINRTIYAAIAATGCLIVLCWMVPGIGLQITSGPNDSSIVFPLIVFIAMRLGFLLAGLVLLLHFGKKWLGNSPQVEPVLATEFSSSPIRNAIAAPAKVVQVRQLAQTSQSIASPKVPAWPMYRALIWQSFRQYKTSFLIAIACGVPLALLGFVMMLDGPSSLAFENGYRLMLYSPVLMTGIGALLVFGRDHRDGNFRFFQQHVECGKKVWFARMLPVLILALTSLVAISFTMLVGLGFARVSNSYVNLFPYTPWALFGLLSAFAIGQFNSLLFRSGVFSFAFTIIMGSMLIVWMYWLSAVDANLWLYLAPIPLAMLAIGWWWTPRWLAGKNRISQLVIPHALLAVTALATVSGFGYQRYTEYRPAEFSLDAEQKKFNGLQSGGNDSFSSARSICASAQSTELRDDGTSISYATMIPVLFGTGRIDGAEEYLADHKFEIVAIKQAIEAFDFDSQAMLDPKSIKTREGQVSKIRFLLALAAKQAEADEELDKALEYWALLLRFDESHPGYSSDDQTALESIMRWSKLPNQSPKLMKQAIKEVGFTAERWERLSDSTAYFSRLDFENWYEAIEKGQKPESRVGLRYVTVVNEMPSIIAGFESERSRRLAHQAIGINHRVYETNEVYATNPKSNFSQRWGAAFPHSFWMSLGVANASTWDGVYVTPRFEHFNLKAAADDEAVRDVLASIQDRRYAQVRLALRGWKLEHDVYPETLDELAPQYFAMLPVDVFSGGSFAYSPKGFDQPIKWTGDQRGITSETPFLLPWTPRTSVDESKTIEDQFYARRSSQFENSYDYSDSSRYVCTLFFRGNFELEE